MSESRKGFDPYRTTVEQAVQVLTKIYRKRVDVEKIKLDLQNGAPQNEDGTINIVSYTAWQAKEMGRSR